MPSPTRRVLTPLACLLVSAGLLIGCSDDSTSKTGAEQVESGASTTAADADAGDSGEDAGNGEGDDTTGATEPAAPTPSVPETPADAEGCRTPEAAADETEAPEVEVPAEAATGLDATDDIPGCGDLVEATSTVSVQYILKARSTGEVVDSSWERGEPFEVTLGQGRVISGWDLGIPGMRAGGRRTLVLGPDYGYGAMGSPPVIGENDTLVFVVDVLSVS